MTNFSFADVLWCTYTQMHEARSVLFWQVFYLREYNLVWIIKRSLLWKFAHKIVASLHPSNLMSLSQFSLFVFVKQLKFFSKLKLVNSFKFSEGKQKGRGEMPLSIEWGSEYWKHLNSGLLEVRFSEHVIQMPGSYYLPGKKIVDKFSAIQIRIQTTG